MLTSRSYGGRRETSCPAARSSPRPGISKPAIIRSVVVLPEPEGPSIVKNSPPRDVEVDGVDRGHVAEALDEPADPDVRHVAHARRRQRFLEQREPFPSSSSEIVSAGSSRITLPYSPQERRSSPRSNAASTIALARSGRPLDELEADHRAEPADLADLVVPPRQRVEPGAPSASPTARRRAQESPARGRPRAARRPPRPRERVAAEGAAEAAGRDGVHELGAAGDARRGGTTTSARCAGSARCSRSSSSSGRPSVRRRSSTPRSSAGCSCSRAACTATSVRLLPPLTISDEELEDGLGLLDDALERGRG